MRPAGTKTWVEVSRSAIRDNAEAVAAAIGPAKLMAVVKSNAYGHGIEQAVSALKNHADWFGVDSFLEAERVRRSVPETPILILGYTRREDLRRALRLGCRLTVYDPAMLPALAAAAGKRTANIHLKIETGTSRQGIQTADLPAFIRAAKKYPRLEIEGVSTHFANSEDVDPAYAGRQIEAFKTARAALKSLGLEPPISHAACSAAGLRYPEARCSMVRAGIALYGLWPSPETRKDAAALSLRPALAWKTIVAQVKKLPAGTPVSYGLTERLRRDSTIAVLPVGYWDGLDRTLSSAGEVLVNGKRAKIIGRVCMNMCMIDVTDAGRVRPEQEVVLIGRQKRGVLTADEMAEKSGTIHYEVVTRINPTLPRFLVD